MRTIFYSVVNTKTKAREFTTCQGKKRAEEKLAELQEQNPNNCYIITYKYGNI